MAPANSNPSKSPSFSLFFNETTLFFPGTDKKLHKKVWEDSPSAIHGKLSEVYQFERIREINAYRLRVSCRGSRERDWTKQKSEIVHVY